MAPLPPRYPPDHASLLSRFRGPTRRSDLHPVERGLVAVTAVHLCFLPWALGTVHLWSQWVSLALSAAGLFLALRRRAVTEKPGAPALFTRPLARLFRFPLFWAGFVLLAYIAVQGLNPAWRYTRNETMWWIVPLPHAAWLPSGVDVPFPQAGPWRQLVVLASLWLLVCSAWVGFLRRLSYRIVLSVMVANAGLLSMVGLIQQLSGAKEIFWLHPPANAAFLASFIYRNHGGAYLNLLLAVAAGLAWWHHGRAQRRMEKSSPAGPFAFGGLLVGCLVLFSNSRMSVALLLGFVAVVVVAFAVDRIARPAAGGRAVLVGLALVFAAFLGTGLFTLQVEKVWKRMETVLNDPVASSRDRAQAHRAAAGMLQEHWPLGWGAGCFRYGFPRHAMQYPDIYYAGPAQRKLWEHAHNDLLQYPIELGLAGMAPVLFALGFLAWQLVAWRFWLNPLAVLVVSGCLLTVVHGWVDFVFQCPAILLTWGFLLVAARRWAEYDEASPP